MSTGSGWLFEDRAEGAFGRGRLDLRAEWADGQRATGLVLRVTGAFNVGAVPAQHPWYLGGRNTLPGHGFHDYVGDHAAAVDATVWRTLVPRLLRLRFFAAAGWAELDTDAPTPLDPDRMFWQPGPTDGVASSVGVGVGLVDGLVRLDYGVRTDDWDGYVMLSVRPDLWSFL